MLLGLRSLWEPSVVPPTPPTPVPTILRPGGGIRGTERKYEEELWEEIQYQRWLIEQQNADDLEVVRILTEFLSRIN